jgi:hypothetical protein
MRTQKAQVSADEIREWKDAFLIPGDDVGLEPPVFDAELGAADFLTAHMAWLTTEVRAGRFFMRECVEGDHRPSIKLDTLRRAFFRDSSRNAYLMAFGWFFAVLKLAGGIPPQLPVGLHLFPRGQAPEGSEGFTVGQFTYVPFVSPKDVLFDLERNSIHSDPESPASENED